jgi:2,3-bisphosphoglycerate-independent phosphoglycerate mutase
VEAVDLSLGRLLATLETMGGTALVTADHGNADEMYERDKKGQIARDAVSGRPLPKTSHSLNPVRLVVADYAPGSARTMRTDLPQAGLANVAATVLQILGYTAPEGYEPSLVR